MKKPVYRFLLIFLICLCLLTGKGDVSAVSGPATGELSQRDIGQTGETPLPEDSYFKIYFIDVGQGDAALILCDGSAMLIDGGNPEESSLIYSFLKEQSLDRLDYIVCTHAHEDHAGGLSGALNYAVADQALVPATESDGEAYADFLKYLDKQDATVTVPTAGDSFPLGSAQMEVLGPIRPDAEEPNNTSIVLRVVYGNTSFLFTGDAQREEEQDILASGCAMQSTVLKVGHHGSATSTTYPFLREVMPQYAVISVGKDNPYGHPTEETLSRLRDADVTVFRTDLQGDILCTSDGETVTFSVQKNEDADTIGLGPNSTAQEPEEPSAAEAQRTTYILNTNTHKFHYPFCSSVGAMSEKNKLVLEGTREEIIAMGYSPCKRCSP